MRTFTPPSTRAWWLTLAASQLLPSVLAAQPNSTTVDYLVVSPGYGCTRISGGGLGPHSVQFEAKGWNAGPNAIPENRAGDDISLGVVPVEWAMADTIYDAHSGLTALTESPDGDYGNNWNVVVRMDPVFDLTSAASAELEFWHHYELVGFDEGFVEVMTSSGWDALAVYNGTLGNPEEFHFVSIDLSEYLGETIEFRFRVHTDIVAVADGWVLDDFVVRVDGEELFADGLEDGLGNWTVVNQWGLTIPENLDPPGTISDTGLFVASDRTGATFIRAIYDSTLEARSDVDVLPPDWVP